jgi:hypothetical protein
MSLTSPLIDQAFALKFRLLSTRFTSEELVRNRKMSAAEMLRQLPSYCSKLHNHKKRLPSTDHHYIDQGLAVPGSVRLHPLRPQF